jgi:hypothetical protein
LSIEHIRTVEKWDDRNEPKVSSKITYAPVRRRGGRWGYGVVGEAAENSHVLKETKLSLETPRLSDAPEDLKRTVEVLDNMSVRELDFLAEDIPRHVTKTPLEIVTDYLWHIADAVRHAIDTETPSLLGKLLVDLIFTHPAGWDKQEMNLTFRAVMSSFGQIFPEISQTNGNIYTASEPEACPQYIMRDPQGSVTRGLGKGGCFIVVDAGGGTVDLAAYEVKEVEPFRVELATTPTGEGSVPTLRGYVEHQLTKYEA